MSRPMVWVTRSEVRVEVVGVEVLIEVWVEAEVGRMSLLRVMKPTKVTLTRWLHLWLL